MQQQVQQLPEWEEHDDASVPPEPPPRASLSFGREPRTPATGRGVGSGHARAGYVAAVGGSDGYVAAVGGSDGSAGASGGGRGRQFQSPTRCLVAQSVSDDGKLSPGYGVLADVIVDVLAGEGGGSNGSSSAAQQEVVVVEEEEVVVVGVARGGVGGGGGGGGRGGGRRRACLPNCHGGDRRGAGAAAAGAAASGGDPMGVDGMGDSSPEADGGLLSDGSGFFSAEEENAEGEEGTASREMVGDRAWEDDDDGSGVGIAPTPPRRLSWTRPPPPAPSLTPEPEPSAFSEVHAALRGLADLGLTRPTYTDELGAAQAPAADAAASLIARSTGSLAHDIVTASQTVHYGHPTGRSLARAQEHEEDAQIASAASSPFYSRHSSPTRPRSPAGRHHGGGGFDGGSFGGSFGGGSSSGGGSGSFGGGMSPDAVARAAVALLEGAEEE